MVVLSLSLETDEYETGRSRTDGRGTAGVARQAKGGAREGCPYAKMEWTEAGASMGALTLKTC